MKFIKSTKTVLLPLLEAANNFAGPTFTSVDDGTDKDKTPVVRLVFSENKLEIQAINWNAGINLDLEIENEDDASYLLPIRLLIETISKLESDEVLLGLDKAHLVIKSPSGKTSLKEFPDGNPTPPAKVPTHATLINGVDFSHALGMVAFACARPNSSHESLQGVRIDLSSDKEMTLVGTDGFRISAYASPLGWEQLGRESYEKGFTVPTKTVTALVKCLAKQLGTIKMGVSSTQFAVEWDNGYVFTTLVQGNYPDWKAIFPEKTKTKITFLNGFQNAVRAAKILATGSDHVSPGITLDITNERTFVKSGSDEGSSTIKLVPSFEGVGNLEIMFNGDYLPDHIQGEITVGLNEKNTPSTFESNLEQGWRYLLMPLALLDKKVG